MLFDRSSVRADVPAPSEAVTCGNRPERVCCSEASDWRTRLDRGAQRAVVLESFLNVGNQLRVLEHAVVGDDGGRIAGHRRDGPVGGHASALRRHGFEGWLCDGEMPASGEEGCECAHGHAAGHYFFINHVSAPGLDRVELLGGQGKSRISDRRRPPPPVPSR